MRKLTILPGLIAALAVAGAVNAADLTVDQNKRIEQSVANRELGLEISARLDSVDSIAESASFSIGAEAADAIDVAITFKDERGVALAIPAHAECWLSELSTGLDVATTAGTSAFTTQTHGTLLKSDTTGLLGRFVSSAAGLLTIRVAQTSATVPDYYLACTNGAGKILVSGAINFGA